MERFFLGDFINWDNQKWSLINWAWTDEWRTFAKVFPPLRNKKDKKAIYDALIEDKIDIISSHHSPQDQDSKRLPFEQAEFGIIGFETLLPISLDLHINGKMKIIKLIDKLTNQPAKLLNLNTGKIAINSPADLTLIDIKTSNVLNLENMNSKSNNSLFDEYEAKGKILCTIVDGRIVYTDQKFNLWWKKYMLIFINNILELFNNPIIIVYFITSFIIGSIPFGLILSNISGYGDIRKIGSGNIGATNVLRTGNKFLAIVTLILDVSKSFIMLYIVKTNFETLFKEELLIHLYISIAILSLLGHMFSPFILFKGGKGIATSAGILFFINWLGALIVLFIWLIAAIKYKTSSIGALTSSFFAPIILSKNLIENLQSANGVIINITSIASDMVHEFAGPAYATSKAALKSLTREMASDLSKYNIRVNAIAPGEIETSMITKDSQHLVNKIPMGRFGKPEEVASVIYSMCSESFSYVNGTEIAINGGQTV